MSVTNPKKRIAIFISGRGSNMLAIAQQVKNGILTPFCDIVLVFSNKKNAPGLLAATEEFGLNTAVIESKGKKRQSFDQEVIDLLDAYAIDYIVLAGYMRVLSSLFIQTYPNRIINIHPADTSQHKGLHAYEWAWEHKLPATKITVHLVDEGVDTGKVLAQHPVNLIGIKSLAEVEQRGLKVEHQFYSEVLAALFSGQIKNIWTD